MNFSFHMMLLREPGKWPTVRVTHGSKTMPDAIATEIDEKQIISTDVEWSDYNHAKDAFGHVFEIEPALLAYQIKTVQEITGCAHSPVHVRYKGEIFRCHWIGTTTKFQSGDHVDWTCVFEYRLVPTKKVEIKALAKEPQKAYDIVDMISYATYSVGQFVKNNKTSICGIVVDRDKQEGSNYYKYKIAVLRKDHIAYGCTDSTVKKVLQDLLSAAPPTIGQSFTFDKILYRAEGHCEGVLPSGEKCPCVHGLEYARSKDKTAFKQKRFLTKEIKSLYGEPKKIELKPVHSGPVNDECYWELNQVEKGTRETCKNLDHWKALCNFCRSNLKAKDAVQKKINQPSMNDMKMHFIEDDIVEFESKVNNNAQNTKSKPIAQTGEMENPRGNEWKPKSLLEVVKGRQRNNF